MAEVETYGTGQVERTADRAGLRAFYAEHAKDRTGATSALTNRITAVESVLRRDGVLVRERQLSVQDDWDGKRRSGARASQSYTLRVTDLTILNDLIAALVAAEPVNLQGPFWELGDHADAESQAQREAVADATRRAENYAQALGRRLGPLLRISDGQGNLRPGGFSATAVHLARSAGQLNIAELSLDPQMVAVSATCTMTWTIAE